MRCRQNFYAAIFPPQFAPATFDLHNAGRKSLQIVIIGACALMGHYLSGALVVWVTSLCSFFVDLYDDGVVLAGETRFGIMGIRLKTKVH